MARALANEDPSFAATRWSDALSARRAAAVVGRVAVRISPGGFPGGVGGLPARSRRFAPSPGSAARPGWYYGDRLWRLRGLLDLAGRRHRACDGAGAIPRRFVAGDTLDFWRVEAVEPDRLLRLAAEMRLPGRAWLAVRGHAGEGREPIRQTALFDPVGLGGLVYWYGLWGSTRWCSRACCGTSSGRPVRPGAGTR